MLTGKQGPACPRPCMQMNFQFWRKVFTPSRVIAALSLATITCAVLIANFSLGEERDQSVFKARAVRLTYVHDTVEATDEAKAALRQYEITQLPSDKEMFLAACDAMASKVSSLRRAEHMTEEQSDQIIDLCVAIRQQLDKIDTSAADRMTQSGFLLDRIRRVVLGFGMDELREQEDKLAEQSSAAALGRRITAGMAVIEIFLVAGIVFLVVRLTRLEHLATVCAWSHRLLYDGQWVSLERYLDQRFGIRASDGLNAEQAAKIVAENEKNGQELVRLVEFEKAAGDKAKEATRAIHSVRNHLTAVLCFSEMAENGDAEAQRDMASRVLNHANTISAEVNALHNAVRGFTPEDAEVAPVKRQRPAA
jgi:hypothetical protein